MLDVRARGLRPKLRDMRIKLQWIAVIAAITGAACLDEGITGVREASMRLTASASSAAVGDSVTFDFEVEGTGLVGALLEYGDGASDTIRFSGGFDPIDFGLPAGEAPSDTVFFDGPVQGGATRRHAFTAPGSYLVVGRVVAAAGIASDSVVVVIR